MTDKILNPLSDIITVEEILSDLKVISASGDSLLSLGKESLPSSLKTEDRETYDSSKHLTDLLNGLEELPSEKKRITALRISNEYSSLVNISSNNVQFDHLHRRVASLQSENDLVRGRLEEIAKWSAS